MFYFKMCIIFFYLKIKIFKLKIKIKVFRLMLFIFFFLVKIDKGLVMRFSDKEEV